ncbi:hypothetical protein V8J88_10665 [Massilia sp. W12]|uniref:hypothetical protein n=1 Tax=Massilia sp. W12 TaxID=3126507 RepID=UPI0030D16449
MGDSKSKKGLDGLVDSVVDGVKDAGKAVGDAAQAAGNAVKDTAQNAGNAVKGAAQNAGEAVKDAGKAVGDAAQAAGNAVKGTAQNAGNAVKGAAQNAGEAVKDAGKAVGDAAQAAGNAVKNTAQNAGNAVKDAAQAVGNVVQDAAQAVGSFVEEKFDKNTARIWFDEEIRKNGWPEAAFAQVKARKNLGIGFSGGGIRAATAAFGQARALHQAGLMKHVRYTACISGGSWFAIPWTYLPASISDNDFFGKYTPPEKLDWEDLQKQYAEGKACNFMEVLEQAEFLNKKALQKVFFEGEGFGNSSKDESWGDLIGDAYLKPLTLYHKGAQRYATWGKDVRQSVIKRNDTLQANDFDCVEHERPYLLVNGVAINWNLMGKFEALVAMAADKPEDPKDYPFYPFEFTPLYSGINTMYSGKETEGFFKFGGGYIENIGFDTKDPFGRLKGNFVEVKTKQQFNRLSVQDMMAVSGAAPAFHALLIKSAANLVSAGLSALAILNGINGKLLAGKGVAEAAKRLSGIFPRFYYWHLDKNKNVGSDNLYFGDGGFLDNYGLFPLLRRKVRNIIIFINTDTPFKISKEGRAALEKKEEMKAADFEALVDTLQIDGALPALFGFHDSKASSAGFPHKWSGHLTQVFKKADFQKVLREMSARLEKGEPVYSVTCLDVVRNGFMGVAEYTDLNICFVMLQSCKKWEQQLTGEFRSRLVAQAPDAGQSANGANNATAANTASAMAQGLGGLSGDKQPWSRKAHDASLAAFPNFATFGVHDTLESKLTQGEKIAKFIDLQEMNREQTYLLANFTDWTMREVLKDARVANMFE